MAMRHPLVAVADMRGDAALRAFRDALGNDRIIDRQEARNIGRALIAWKRDCRAARVAGSLATCIENGVDVGRYFDGRVNDYRAAVDETSE